MYNVSQEEFFVLINKKVINIVNPELENLLLGINKKR